jgi:hypothetical protein
MLLADLPWFWCAEAVPAEAPPGPAHRAAGPDSAALVRAAADLPAGDIVVVVPPDVRPWPIASGLSIGNALRGLVARGARTVLWPAENAVTGTIAQDHGLWLASCETVNRSAQALLDGTAASVLHPVVSPLMASTWTCAATPETAFRAGHAEMDAPRDASLALTASLGADHPNGDWWGIGAARALMGDEVDAAWDEEAQEPGDRPSLAARRAELSRVVRVRLGLAVHPLSPQAAAAVRAMRSPVAPPGVWDRHAVDLADVLPGGAAHPGVTGVRLARALAWGEP